MPAHMFSNYEPLLLVQLGPSREDESTAHMKPGYVIPISACLVTLQICNC